MKETNGSERITTGVTNIGRDGEEHPVNAFEQASRPREFTIYGCKAHYALRGLTEVPRLTEVEACRRLVSTLQRFNIALIGDGHDIVPAFARQNITSVPWKGKCQLRLHRSGFSLGGFFFGDSLMYLPVLGELTMDVLGIDAAPTAGVTTEMFYGFEIVLDQRARRGLIRDLETAAGWLTNTRHDFISTSTEGARDVYETTVDLATERTVMLSRFFHDGLLRPVEAIPLAEGYFLKTIKGFPLRVKLFSMRAST